jgi:cytochrome P450
MMGVPETMLPTVAEWSDRMGNATANGLPIDYDNDPFWLAGERAKKEFADFVFERIQYRRAHPGEDLISEIVHSEIGKTHPDDALMVNTRQLLFAGNETTSKWLGHIIMILARNLDLRKELAQDRELMNPALDEFIRWEPILHTLPRAAQRDGVEVAGAHLKKGEQVLLLLGAANRDPARYDDPDRLDIRRERKGNLGFGYGVHNCLGLALARLEVSEAIGALLARFPNYALHEPIRYTGFDLRGPAALEVTLG